MFAAAKKITQAAFNHHVQSTHVLAPGGGGGGVGGRLEGAAINCRGLTLNSLALNELKDKGLGYSFDFDQRAR